MNFKCIEIQYSIWYIGIRNKKETKNGLQSSQQWYILDEYLRFDKKEVLPYDKTVAWNLIGYIHRK